jgi:hypothetical protein
MARIRRDWSTLFRREKKPAAIEAEFNIHTVTPSKQAMAIDLPQAELNSRRGTAVGSLEPIVVANQSVMPGNLDELETSLASFVPEVADELPTESSSTLDRERPRLEEVEFLDDRDRQDNLTVVLAETVKPALDPDDGITSQPDFENVEPIIDVHESEPNADDTLPSELNANADDDRQTDWTAFYLGFGISSVLAIMCYRRGAT